MEKIARWAETETERQEHNDRINRLYQDKANLIKKYQARAKQRRREARADEREFQSEVLRLGLWMGVPQSQYE